VRARTVLRSTLVNLPQGACSHDPCRRLTPHCCAPPGSLPLDTSGTISRTLTVNLLCNGEDLPAPEAGVAGGADVVMNWPTAAACNGSGMTGWYIVIFAGLAAGVYLLRRTSLTVV
jgi:hypothetical protein